MASIEQRKRSDGGVSARVRWRLGGSRQGAVQVETFTAAAIAAWPVAGVPPVFEAAFEAAAVFSDARACAYASL